MKTIAFIVLCLLPVFYADAQQRTSMDTLVRNASADFLNDTSHAGLSIGILHKGTTYTYNFGTIKKGSKILPTANTVYEIGSISKTFTGVLLARAVTAGKIKLEDDVRKYLDGSYPNLEYQGQPIKIIHLVNHTSRLPRFLPDREDIFQHRMDSIPFLLAGLHKGYSKTQYLQDLHQVKLDTLPGYNYRYSNAAAQLLGFILEKVYNTTFDELLAREITRPLSMRQTGASLTTGVAQGYDAWGREMPYSPVLSKPAGGICSSVSDMLRYIQFHLNEKDSIVRLSHTATQTYSDSAGIALFWRINTTSGGLRKYWHTGGTFGFSSYCVVYPQINTGIILLSNEFDLNSQGGLINIADRIVDGLLKE